MPLVTVLIPAYNAAIDAASGQWIVPLDADDWFRDDRLECLIGLAKKHGADIIADGRYLQ